MLSTIPSHRRSIIDEGQLRPRRQLDDPSDDGESLHNFYFLTILKKRVKLGLRDEKKRRLLCFYCTAQSIIHRTLFIPRPASTGKKRELTMTKLSE